MKLHSFLTVLFVLFAAATITISAQDMPEHHDNAKAEPCCEKEMSSADEGEGKACCGKEKECCKEGKECCKEGKKCSKENAEHSETSSATNGDGHKCSGDCDGNCGNCKSEGTETSAVDKVEIFNAYCPVQGGEVDPEVETVEYNGKNYGFCCPGCDAKFKADPEKWSKNISPCGKKFIGEKS